MKKTSLLHMLTLFFIFIFSSSTAQDFTSSELPIVVIQTDDDIPDEPKIQGHMGIIHNPDTELNLLTDPFTEWDGNIGIETRGNSTQDFDKLTYSIELRTSTDADTSANLFGMGGEEDWILHAMVIDKTQIRIPMCFDLARSMGHYASRYQYVEVVINDEYQGLYILCERIKRDDDRVDIAKLDADDLAGDSLTGGYILKIDWLDEASGFESEFESQSGDPMFYQYYYPRPENIQPAQEQYIAGFINEFEEAVFADDYENSNGTRYTDLIDVTSFVDFLIINEFSKNSDGYKLSSFLHKNRNDNGGRLKAGPIWDFDQTFGLSLVCSSNLTNGWTYLQNQEACEDLESMPMWWQSMMNDPVFVNHLACRWTEFRSGILHQDSLFARIDQHVAMLENPLSRNFEQWDFIGEYIWIEPEPVPETYEEEIEVLKDWISQRLVWLDANMPGNCSEDIINAVDESSSIESIQLFPNPSSGLVNFKAESTGLLTVRNNLGQIVGQHEVNSGLNQVDLGTLPNGMYLVIVSNQRVVKQSRIMIVH